MIEKSDTIHCPCGCGLAFLKRSTTTNDWIPVCRRYCSLDDLEELLATLNRGLAPKIVAYSEWLN